MSAKMCDCFTGHCSQCEADALLIFFKENLGAWHLNDRELVASTMDPEDIETRGSPVYNYIVNDITTNFAILVGIYFPSVTGCSCARCTLSTLHLKAFAFQRNHGRLEPLGRPGRRPALHPHRHDRRHFDDELRVHQRRVPVRRLVRRTPHAGQVRASVAGFVSQSNAILARSSRLYGWPFQVQHEASP